MTFKEIQDLIRLIAKTELTEFKLKKEDFEILVRSGKYQKSDGKSQVTHSPMVSMPMAQPMQQHVPAAQPAPAPAANPVVEDLPTSASESAESSSAQYIEIKSPIVGTFYRSSGPDKPPFKKVGDHVDEGETVCIVEAMKLFNEIESEISGKIVKVLIEDASPVEYDQPLFLVDPKG